MAGREDLAPKGLDILTRDVSLDEIQSLFDITTGHDHDGTNSAIVSWNNIADKPSGLYYSLTAPTNEFTSSDDGVGNLTLSWKTQSAGLVLASPSASSGTPSFRSLIISDIPTITLSKLDNIASGSILGRKTALTGEVEALTITDIKTMLDVINYGVCTTDGATVNKTVDIANFALSLGTKVTVKFDNANSVSNPTLNVSSTGTKAIYNGSSAIDPAMLEAGKIYDFVYDGTNYVLISGSGSIPVNANSKVYVATPSQTEFSIAELYNINTVSVAVFRNGIFQLVSVDYTLDDTSGAEKIILSESCVGGETIVIQVNTTNATVDMSAHNHTFNELTDVSYYPNNHDTIVWNSTTSMWEPKPVSDFINSSSKSFTSIVGQVDFDVSDIYPTDYFNFAVFRNGLLQLQGLDYVLDTSVPGSEKVTLTDACVINEIIIVQFNSNTTHLNIGPHSHTISDITTNNELDMGEISIVFTETTNTSSSGTVTIDWGNSNHQTITLTEDVVMTFLDPVGVGNFTLRILQDATGYHDITFPTFKTSGGLPINITMNPNAEDILMLYFDGTNYIASLLSDIK